MKTVSVSGSIRLDSFLKWAGIASTGGQGKFMVQSGKVAVNGTKTVSRGHMLADGDTVKVEDYGIFKIEFLRGRENEGQEGVFKKF